MNWHALEGGTDGNSYRVVYHIAVPNVNNKVGFGYRASLLAAKMGGTTVLPDGDGTNGTISTTEKASIVAGALLEVVRTENANPGLTLSQLASQLDATFTALSDTGGAFITGLKRQLDYYGGTSSS